MYPKASEPSDLAKGLRDNFASGYLTLISIVLGVALGLLAQNLFPNPKPPGFSTSAYPLSFLTFLIICGTFHYYYFWVSFIRIYPTFNQVLLPFLAGSGVIVLAASIHQPEVFWIAAAATYAIGCIAFWNTGRLNKETVDPKAPDQIAIWLAHESSKNILFFVVLALIAMIAATISRFPSSELKQCWMAFGMVILNLALLSLSTLGTRWCFLLKVYERLERKPHPGTVPAQVKCAYCSCLDRLSGWIGRMLGVNVDTRVK